MINKLTQLIESTKGNPELSKIGALLNIDTDQSDKIFLSILSLVHEFFSHEDRLMDNSKKSKLDDNVINMSIDFVKHLTPETVKEINKLYQAYNLMSGEVETIESISDDLIFARVYDHDDTTLGFSPIVKITIRFTNNDDTASKTLMISPTDLKTICGIFDRIYKNNIKHINEYKKKSDYDLILRND